MKKSLEPISHYISLFALGSHHNWILVFHV